MIASVEIALEAMPDGMGGERAGFCLRVWERVNRGEDLIVALELRWPQTSRGPANEQARRITRDVVEAFLR